MVDASKSKWYDSKPLIIILFFIFSPLGIYGILKRKTAMWKKLLYIIPGSFLFSFMLVGTLAAIFMDRYKDGIDYYNKKEYIKAYENLKMVSSDDPNYKDAILKITEIKPIVDSLMIVKNSQQDENKKMSEESQPKIDFTKFKAFQQKWADSLIKDWHGKYIISNKINDAGDTIHLQLTKIATKGNGNINSINQTIFQKDYDSLLVKQFGNKSQHQNTVINLLPNAEQYKENQIRDERYKKIQMQFSSWDGSHRELERYVKDNMNDPSSFDHIQTNYADKGKYILVQMKFRGKNAFGAKVINVVTAKVDLNGNVLSVSQ